MFVHIYHKPAAWMHEDGWLTRSEEESIRWRAHFPGTITPLYALDPKEMPRKPLAESMAIEVMRRAMEAGIKDPVELVRAVEAAHGIE